MRIAIYAAALPDENKFLKFFLLDAKISLASRNVVFELLLAEIFVRRVYSLGLTILDAAVILVFVIFIFSGAKNGIAKSILSLVGSVVALLVTTYVSGIAADFVYSSFVKEKLRTSLASAISHSGPESIFEALPNFITNSLKIYGVTEERIYSSLGRGSPTVQADIAVNIVSPAVIGVINAVFTILIFIVLIFFIGGIVKNISGVFKMPVLKQIDGFFGAAFGILKAYIFVAVLAVLARLSLPILDLPFDCFSPSAVEASMIFRHFYDTDFIHVIAEKMGLN
jgi:uncharacterized membrane protein required for colicin V production